MNRTARALALTACAAAICIASCTLVSPAHASSAGSQKIGACVLISNTYRFAMDARRHSVPRVTTRHRIMDIATRSNGLAGLPSLLDIVDIAYSGNDNGQSLDSFESQFMDQCLAAN